MRTILKPMDKKKIEITTQKSLPETDHPLKGFLLRKIQVRGLSKIWLLALVII